MKHLSDERKPYIDYMLENSNNELSFDELTITTDLRREEGSFIAPDGTVYGLRKNGTHGVVAAVLFPELAHSFGLPQPTGSLDDVPKMAYQEFELGFGYRIPIIRIASWASITISHGRGEFWPTDLQIEALRLYLSKNGLLDSEVYTDSSSMTGKKLLQLLRNGEEDDDYVKRADKRENY